MKTGVLDLRSLFKRAARQEPPPGIFAQSLRFRLTLFFVFLFGLALSALSLVLYLEFSAAQQEDFDAALYNYAADVASGIDFSVFGGFRIAEQALFGKEKILPFKFGRSQVQIVNGQGELLARSGTSAFFAFPADEKDRQALQSGKSVLQTIKIEQSLYRAISYPIRRDFVPDGMLVQVAVTLETLEKRAEKVRTYFLFAIPILLVAVFVLGYFFASAALAPLGAIIARANRLQANDLDQRFVVGESQDELNQLSLTLNHLFDRLQRAFVSQDEFVANASHQLKTPLAIIKGELGVFRSKPRSPQETEALVATLSQELDYLIHIVDDLLLLARVEAGKNSLQMLPLQVDDIVMTTVSRLEGLARAKDVKLKVNFAGAMQDFKSGDYSISGDPELLQTMFQALVENAIQHSPAEQTVAIEIARVDQFISVQIRNQGQPIPPADLGRIFERFYQARAAGTASTGVGLGLAIARRIAELHEGEIRVQSERQQGTVFEVRIKKF